jgi:hypothetical protein
MLARTALALLGCLAWSRVAHADPTAEDPLQKDPLLPTSIAVGAAGITTAVAGAFVWRSSNPSPVCGALGCIEGRDNTSERAKGAALVGVGAGLAVASAAGLALSLGAPLEGDEERDGPVAATFGLALTSMSLGALGGGLTYGGVGASNPEFGRAVPFFLVSGGLAGIGLPLLIAGASVEDEAERRQEALERRKKRGKRDATSADRARDRERRQREQRAIASGEIGSELKSPAMVGIGSTLMIAGVGGFVGCMVGAVNVDSGGGFMDFSGLERGLFILGGVASLGAGAGAGIPLVVIGSRRVPTKVAEEPAERHAPPIQLAVGPGTVTVGGAF